MTLIRIGVIQHSIESDPRVNLRRIIDLVSTASNIDILSIYENWLSRREVVSENFYLEASREVLETARSRVFVAGSSYVYNERREVYSRSIVIDRYNRISEGGKIFPSYATNERSRIKSYSKPAIYLSGFISIASVICVDLMYPEISRYVALRGAKIIFNPSIIPRDRKYLWRSIGSSRASENTVYLVHVNATKILYVDGRPVDGGSFISDPWGYVIFDTDDSIGLFVAEIDLSVIDRVRERWRYLEDVRDRFYSNVDLNVYFRD